MTSSSWSFQRALDGVAAERLGTRLVGPTPTPLLDAASRLLIQQREVCREVMERLSRAPGVSTAAKSEARFRFLAASARVRAGAARRKQMKELELFRDVEQKHVTPSSSRKVQAVAQQHPRRQIPPESLA